MHESSPRRSHRSIAVGITCFALGSIMVVRADTIVDGSGRAANVSTQHELATADDGTRARLDQVLARLASLETAIAASGNVTGAVAVTNFPATQDVNVSGGVAVTNLPASQAVTGTVDIGNQPTVNVASTPQAPIHAQLAGGQAIAIPADDVLFENFQAQVSLEGGCGTFAVPAGRQLIMETFTAWTDENALDLYFMIEARQSGAVVRHVMSADHSQWVSLAGMVHTATHSVKLRFDGGATHTVCVAWKGYPTNGGGDGIRGEASIAGHLL